MRHLLLTRPDGRNAPLAERLAALGFRVTCQPMVELVAESHPGPNPLNEVDGAFFVSPTAVEHAHRLLAGNWPQLQYFAVGAGTADALKQCGVQAHCPPAGEETTEGVLALPQWRAIRRCAIVRGNGGREAMAEGLKSRGIGVIYWEIYRRQRPEIAPKCAESWRQGGVDAILATSGEILENLFAETPLALHDWLRQCHWLVPVERVAALARQRGCQSVIVTGGAGDDAIVRCLGSVDSG